MENFDLNSHTRVIFGPASIARLGEVARELGFKRTLLVADQGLLACGHVERALRLLSDSGIEVFPFDDFDINPDARIVEVGRAFAAPLNIDSIIGLGGGSSLDCAKGINFVLTGGGTMRDYWGFGKVKAKMLPMIGVPTTSGTGSEAQSYALISDAESHVKMACGDKQAAFRVAILDPELTVTQPRHITATAGFDAISHSVESYVTKAGNPLSRLFSRESWALLSANYERVLANPSDIEARGAMQIGAFYAGVAIENSMLGATHACANPLTAHHGTEHGVAIGLMLPWVVRWNAPVVEAKYGELLNHCDGRTERAASEVLAKRLEDIRQAGDLPGKLSEISVQQKEIPILAAEAAQQWTGKFNPRDFGVEGAEELYNNAF